MTPEDLTRELADGRIRPAYLLAGAEPLLREDTWTAIESAVLGDAPPDFNLDRLHGDKTAPGDLLDALRSLPVMAARRLVMLREPDARRGGGKALLDALVSALEELRAGGEDGSVVLVVTAASVDRRARWTKAFSEPAAVVSCDPPKGVRAAAAFVVQEAKRQDVSLASGAAEVLAERVGPQLLLLRRELEKAALYAGPGEKVTRAHVAETSILAADEPIWDLTDAIGEGRRADALGVLGRLLGAGVPPPVVLGTLASHFRKLLRLAGGGRVGAPPFAVRKLESQVRRYSKPRLLGCMSAIHETDCALKGAGSLPPDLALERLVIGLV